MDNVKFYDDFYDVVIIGGALAGCSAGLVLAKNGFKVLILEKHNLPGGVATSFVRGGEEYEASLHEMNAYGKPYEHLFVSDFISQYDIPMHFIPLNECYRYVEKDIDVIIHPGTVNEQNEIDYDIPAREIASVEEDKEDAYKKVKEFLDLCTLTVKISDSMTHDGIKISRMGKYLPMLKTAGYSAEEVMDAIGIPSKSKRILGAYWNYLGTPINEFPFVMFSAILDGYMGHHACIPENYSYEMGVKLANAAEEAGVQIEYCQKVEKVLIKDNKPYAVKTARGDIINCKYVISGTYPNNLYRNMIEPKEAIPKDALKFVNSKEVAGSCFGVILLLDKSCEELGLKDYATFYNPESLSSNELWDNAKTLGPYKYFTTVCQNVANPKTSRKGTSILSSTVILQSDAWEKVTKEEYRKLIQKNAEFIIDTESKRLNVNLRDHILEIVYETPMTVARYTGAYKGSIYGYRHNMDDNIVARTMQEKNEVFIENLYTTGATAKTGDGMAPQFINGNSAAQRIIEKERGAK